DESLPIALSFLPVTQGDSIKRGAKFFADHCMVCHTLRYIQHLPLAENAGITFDKMPLHQKEWLFGAVPPDLTLVAHRHNPQWIYTYLHAFYKDASRPTGYNNLVFKNS